MPADAASGRPRRAAPSAIAWSVDAGDVRVGNVRRPEGADVRVEAADAARSDELRGTLRVLEGREGRISTGSLIPFQVGRRWHRDTVLVEAQSGIEVHPRILGDGKVQLELRPFEATPAAGGVIQGASAETTVVVAPGETVALGGVDTGSRTTARSPPSSASSAAETSQIWMIRSTAMKAQMAVISVVPRARLHAQTSLPIASTSSPRCSTWITGSLRVGGPATGRPSAAEKTPWWHGQNSSPCSARWTTAHERCVHTCENARRVPSSPRTRMQGSSSVG